MLKNLVHYRFLLLLSLVALMLSCTKQDSPECPGTGDLPPVKGMVDLSIHVLGQQEIVPKTRHGESKPGTGDENKIETLLVMVFNQDGSAVETREEIKINDDGTAINVANGEPHQGWNVVTRKLRINMNEGIKKICVIANWPVSATASDEFPVIRNTVTFDELNAIVRRHTPAIGMPTIPPIMCSMLEVDVTDRTTAIDVPLVRQIARVDIYTAMTPELKLSGVEIVLKGVKFRKLAGSSYLLAHTDTDGHPVSPTPNTLWGTTNFVMADHTITSTDPTLESSQLYSTSYLPEHIAADETAASEMVLMVEYNGANSYYAVKLHNGLTDAEKRYWVERNHWYRYNLTITGKGSDNPDQPSHEGVKVGVSNLDWNDGGTTTPGSEIELPVKSIEVMHFKGIARFQLTGTGADPKWNFPGRTFSVSSYSDWIVAHKVEEGASANVITWLEIMTRTFTGTGQREGEVIIMLDNGVQGRVKVKQLDEASSLWRNPTDKTTWYRANIGAARIEDPGFFYQWGRNVAYSPYTPIPGIHVSLTDPLVSYGAVNWDETAEIFARDNPITTWDASAPPSSEWAVDKNPCPSGYIVPNSQQMVKLIGGIMFHDPALSVTSGFTQNPGWWFNGKAAITTGEGLFIRQYHAGRTPGTGYLRVEMGTYLQFRDFKGFAHLSSPSEWTVGPNEDPWGMSVRCVRSGNILYDAGAPDATGTMTDSRFYEVGEEVLPLASTYARVGYRQRGWQVIGSNGNEVVKELPLTGASFKFPTEADYVTLRAVWKPPYTGTFDSNGGTPDYESSRVWWDSAWYNPGTPSREGYIFKGWRPDDPRQSIGQPAIGDVTFTAEWEAQRWEIRVDGIVRATYTVDDLPLNLQSLFGDINVSDVIVSHYVVGNETHAKEQPLYVTGDVSLISRGTPLFVKNGWMYPPVIQLPKISYLEQVTNGLCERLGVNIDEKRFANFEPVTDEQMREVFPEDATTGLSFVGDRNNATVGNGRLVPEINLTWTGSPTHYDWVLGTRLDNGSYRISDRVFFEREMKSEGDTWTFVTSKSRTNTTIRPPLSSGYVRIWCRRRVDWR